MTHSNTSIADLPQCIDQWVATLAKALGTAIKWRRRGNSLHILCEAPSCPEQDAVIACVVSLLKQQDINHIDSGQPPIYQLWCYGRVLGDYEPAWSTAVTPNVSAASYANIVVPESSAREFSRTAVRSDDRLSTTGRAGGAASLTAPASEPQNSKAAIAQQLARILSPLGIAVTIRVKPHGPSAKRLWVACQSSYSPDPSLIAEPLSHELRRFPLEGVRDAVVLVKVRGEERVDWVLKIDLTPAEEILQGWARWGDVEAIGRLLNYRLDSQQLGRIVGGSLTGTTLRFTYQPPVPGESRFTPQAQLNRALDVLSPYLKTLAPRGIQILELAGLEVALREQRAIATDKIPPSPWTLAQAGNLPAVRFLLARLLNPDLDYQLATGGIRVQTLIKDGLMHVMCDGSLCPEKAAVAEAVQALVAQLAIESIYGVRVYGRRAGQRRPRWRAGMDFSDRQRFVPEPSPAFAATDAYVTELVSPEPELSPSPSVTPQRLWVVGQRSLQALRLRLRHAMLRSQVFIPSVSARDLVRPGRSTPVDLQVALVWSAVGLLLFTQVDIATGWWIDSRVLAAESLTQASDTQPQILADQPLTEDVTALLLEQSPFPSFNNPQLDLKLALYYQQLQTAGPPDVIAIGSSRAMRSLDPAVLKTELAALGYPDASIFNFGVNGATAQVVDLILRRILPPEHLPKLVVWADGTRAFNGGRVDETFQAIAASEGYETLAEGRLYEGFDEAIAEGNRPAPDANAAATSWFTRLFESYQAIDDWLSDRLSRVSNAHRHRDRIKAWIGQRFGAISPSDPSAAQATASGFLSRLEGQASAPQLSGPSDGGTGSDSRLSSASAPSNATNPVPISSALAQIEPNGFLPITARFDPSTYYDQYARVSGNYDKDYTNFQLQGEQTEALRNLLASMTLHNVTVIFVNTPLTQEYLDPFRSGHEQTFRQYMIDTALQQDKFVFRDLSRLWLEQPDYHQYFSDPSHLNRYGAVKMSTHLARDPLVPWLTAK